MLGQLVSIFLLTVLGVQNSPLSSNSPEHDRGSYKLFEKPQTLEQGRSRRSITAFLAAEVFLLEGILAAQNSKKVLKVKANKVKRPVKNRIHPTVGGKYVYTPVFTQEKPIPTTVQTTTTHPVSQLDPFTMLAAPDLSLYPKQTVKPYKAQTDKIFYELITAPTDPGSKRQAKQFIHNSLKYGEYELYNPTIVAQEYGRENIIKSTTTSGKRHLHVGRKARKRNLNYGAFELYQPTFVIQ